jgi:hypothetical protein
LAVREWRAMAEALNALPPGPAPGGFAPSDRPPPDEQIRWMAPALIARVGYHARTLGGRLRQPVWRGLRDPAVL